MDINKDEMYWMFPFMIIILFSLKLQINFIFLFAGQWTQTYLGKVRLRSSLTNWELPVLTGRLGSLPAVVAASVCLLPPRRLRTENY